MPSPVTARGAASAETTQVQDALKILDALICEGTQIQSGIVFEAGRPVLFLVNPVAGRTEVVGCLAIERSHQLWFTWARDDDQTIGPADEPASVAKVVRWELGVERDRS